MSGRRREAASLALQPNNPKCAPCACMQYRKPTEAQRELIFQLWLHHGNRWERIRQEADQAGALVDWADCRTKTEAQVGGVGACGLQALAGAAPAACMFWLFLTVA